MTVRMEAFAAALGEGHVDFFTGVPCSYLKAFVSYASGSGALPYTVAASEGEAIGLAAGAWLAGRTPMVLLQNSGLGNCVNPLTSLTHTFGLPLLLMVSHRARDGQDAPQHLLMGEVTYDLLDAMRIEHVTLSDDEDETCRMVVEAARRARERMAPIALVVPKGTFESYSCHVAAEPAPERAPVTEAGPEPAELAPRVAALTALDDALDERDLVVATTGMTSRELFTIHDRPQNFYMMGSMGCALSIGLGVARCRPERKLVVVDGDGALLMKLGTTATVGHYRPGGLLHVVLDNGTYETTGGQLTVSGSVAFDEVARAVGYRRALTLRTPDELGDLVRAFQPGDGPVLAVLRIASGHLDGVGRVGRTPEQIRDDFRQAVLDDVLVP